MTYEELAARELRSMAWHEAAHQAVAEGCGTYAHAFVRPTHSTDPCEKAWVGGCEIDQSRLSRNQRSHVALAGAIGELLADGQTDVYDIVGDLELDDGAVSQTDRKMMGGPINRAMLVRATLRVLKLRPRIEEIVAELTWQAAA